MSRTRPWGATRPLVAIVAMDPAYTGKCGLAVGSLELALESNAKPLVATWWQGDVRSAECRRWLADAVVAVVPAGTRAVLVTESDAFGGMSVARKLGIGVGHVESLLLDMNAVLSDTRRDVSQSEWRKGSVLTLEPRPVGRKQLKRAAVKWARERFPGLDRAEEDAAEALCILEWARGQYTYGEVIGGQA